MFYCTLRQSAVAGRSVSTIYIARVAGRVFRVMSTITTKGRRGTLSLCCRLLTLGRPPVHVLFLLMHRCEVLFRIGTLTGRKCKEGRVTSGTKLRPFITKGGVRRTGQFGVKRLHHIVRRKTRLRRSMGAKLLASGLTMRLFVMGRSRE